MNFICFLLWVSLGVACGWQSRGFGIRMGVVFAQASPRRFDSEPAMPLKLPWKGGKDGRKELRRQPSNQNFTNSVIVQGTPVEEIKKAIP